MALMMTASITYKRKQGLGNKLCPIFQMLWTSLIIDGDTFYVGTEHRGVLRFERVNQ